MLSQRATRCGSALPRITFRWRTKRCTACCSPAASVSRRSCAWPSGSRSPAHPSRCTIARARVLEGEPDHKDVYLTPEEQEKNAQFLPCCSRSKSPLLVLDL